MGLSVTEKILKEHLVSGELEAGDELAIRIDQTLTQDATGTMVYLEFGAMGQDRVRNELAVSYVDHNIIQIGPESADDHAYLQSAAAKYGAVFSRAGNGICHQLHLERFGAPGKTLLGSDSHTCSGGGLGMFAVGAGGIDVAVAMGGEPFYLTTPRVIKIELTGKLKPWVAAKDVILKVLGIFSTKGNVGCVFEYGGQGLKHLEVPARATIANMGAECGVTTSVFPSDEVTRRFLEAQGRVEDWREILADEDAKYDRVVKINLSQLEPLAATPHSPGNIAAIASLVGMKVDQVLIGSCVNSSCRDLKTVAKILEGRKSHPGVSFGIAPGSRQVLGMLAKEGLLSVLLDAGARLLENACGFCIGNSMAPGANAVSLRTTNRNFEGRSGTQSARVYLVSPEIAAVAAIYGRIMDPRTMDELKYPRVREPKSFDIDDSMFVFPEGTRGHTPRPRDSDLSSVAPGQRSFSEVGLAKEETPIQIVRGPHIGMVPKNEPLPEKLDGMAAIKVGDRITTDHIMPAGRRLKHRSNIEIYSKYVFENVDPGFSQRAGKNRNDGLHNFIIAGESYGQGSSREHAALCPMYLGVKAVAAKSVERIHFTNLINFGIVPLLFENAADYDKIEQGDRLSIEGIRNMIANETTAVIRNHTKELDVQVKVDLSKRQEEILLAGGLLNYVA